MRFLVILLLFSAFFYIKTWAHENQSNDSGISDFIHGLLHNSSTVVGDSNISQFFDRTGLPARIEVDRGNDGSIEEVIEFRGSVRIWFRKKPGEEQWRSRSTLITSQVGRHQTEIIEEWVKEQWVLSKKRTDSDERPELIVIQTYDGDGKLLMETLEAAWLGSSGSPSSNGCHVHAGVNRTGVFSKKPCNDELIESPILGNSNLEVAVEMASLIPISCSTKDFHYDEMGFRYGRGKLGCDGAFLKNTQRAIHNGMQRLFSCFSGRLEPNYVGTNKFPKDHYPHPEILAALGETLLKLNREKDGVTIECLPNEIKNFGLVATSSWNRGRIRLYPEAFLDLEEDTPRLGSVIGHEFMHLTRFLGEGRGMDNQLAEAHNVGIEPDRINSCTGLCFSEYLFSQAWCNECLSYPNDPRARTRNPNCNGFLSDEQLNELNKKESDTSDCERNTLKGSECKIANEDSLLTYLKELLDLKSLNERTRMSLQRSFQYSSYRKAIASKEVFCHKFKKAKADTRLSRSPILSTLADGYFRENRVYGLAIVEFYGGSKRNDVNSDGTAKWSFSNGKYTWNTQEEEGSCPEIRAWSGQ
ncbi:MAG: hypothetical protein AAB425_14795 [Bdellovibrionota bacterium]